jgi:hypothetical protein
VVAVFVGALAFGGYLGYLAWANDSFPKQQEPFADYAQVSSVQFNGTEYAVSLTWLNGSAVPLYAQITSSVSDAANSPVCGLDVTSAAPGQPVFLPFGFDGPSEAPTSVTLWIAVKPSDGTAFTIVRQIGNFTSETADILPAQYACTEPNSVM